MARHFASEPNVSCGDFVSGIGRSRGVTGLWPYASGAKLAFPCLFDIVSTVRERIFPCRPSAVFAVERILIAQRLDVVWFFRQMLNCAFPAGDGIAWWQNVETHGLFFNQRSI